MSYWKKTYRDFDFCPELKCEEHSLCFDKEAFQSMYWILGSKTKEELLNIVTQELRTKNVVEQTITIIVKEFEELLKDW